MKRLFVNLGIIALLSSCGGGSGLDTGAFCDGDVLIPFQEKKDKDWGFININGEVVIEPEFEFQPSFAVNGISLIRDKAKDGKMFYQYVKIQDGKAVESNDKWDMAGEFKEGLAPVRNDNEKVRFINESFEDVFTVDAEKVSYFNEGLAAICDKDNKWGFINTSGKEEIKPQYDFVQFGFHDGYAIVGNNTKEGREYLIIDAGGNIKLNLKDKYDDVISYSNGLLKVKDKDEFGFIDLEGNVVIKLNDEWTNVKDFVNGYASFSEDDEWGLVDAAGEIIFKAKFEFPLVVFDDKFWFKDDEDWGLMDMEGNEIIKPAFDGHDNPYPFMCATTIVQVREDYIFVDAEGKEISKEEYENIAKFDVKYVTGQPWNELFESDYFDVGMVKGLVASDFLQIKSAEKFANSFDLNPLLFWGKYDRKYQEVDGEYQFYAAYSRAFEFIAYQYDYSKDSPANDSEEYTVEEGEYYEEEYYEGVEEEYYEEVEEEVIENKYPLDAPSGVGSISYSFFFDDYLGVTDKMSMEAANEYYRKDTKDQVLKLNKKANVKSARISISLNEKGSGKAALVAESIANSWKSVIKNPEEKKEDDSYRLEGEITNGKIVISSNGSSGVTIEVEYKESE